jgi:hypothetical protein
METEKSLTESIFPEAILTNQLALHSLTIYKKTKKLIDRTNIALGKVSQYKITNSSAISAKLSYYVDGSK